MDKRRLLVIILLLQFLSLVDNFRGKMNHNKRDEIHVYILQYSSIF